MGQSNVFGENERRILRAQLRPEEILLLEFLKGIDRKRVQDWRDEDLLDVFK